jgi:hypothetical protein
MGVVVDPAFTVIGLALVLVVGMEWTITAWSERATVDSATNRELRSRLFFPVELPIIGLLVIAVFVISGSRILLAVSKTGSVVVAGVLATGIFVAAIAIAARPQLSRTLLNAVLVVGALGLLAGGVIAAAAGERDFHHGTEVHDSGSSESHDEPADAETTEEGDDHAETSGDAMGVVP